MDYETGTRLDRIEYKLDLLLEKANNNENNPPNNTENDQEPNRFQRKPTEQ